MDLLAGDLIGSLLEVGPEDVDRGEQVEGYDLLADVVEELGYVVYADLAV